MTKVSSFLLPLLFILAYQSTACGQAPAPDADEARKARILENLKYQIPQLQEYEVTMGPLTNSGVPGLDEGSFTVAGQQVQKFLVTSDDSRLFFIAAQVIDVSLSADELAVLQVERERAAAEEARARHATLLETVDGLPMRGNPDAPVTIIEFSDFQCPYCARGYQTMHQLLTKYPDDLKFVYVHFPLNNHPWAEPAAIAAVCVAQQDDAAFWTLHDRYFENQGQITATNVLLKSREFLSDTGIDLDAWTTCAGDTASEAYLGASTAVRGMMATGQQFGLSGTPGFFINGYFVNGAQPVGTFEEVIERARAMAQ